jgi:NitT/TauT family transport system substrate-binding protein
MLAVTTTATLANARDKVIFSLNWIPYGLHYGVFAADAQGYFRQADLDVEIQRGYGSGDTVKRVATGAADIGMADMASVIVGRGNGLAVKQVAVILDRSGDAIYFLRGAGISSPGDLAGRSLGATAGETSLLLLPAFASGAAFDHKAIRIVNITPPAKIPSLMSKTIDSMITFTTEEPAVYSAAIKANMQIGRFLFRDYGVDYYSIGLIVGDETLEKRASLVKRVVDAVIRGYAWAAQNPDAAADVFSKRFPESSRDLTLAQWKIVMDHMLTERTRANGLGYIERDKLESTLTLIKRFQDVKGDIKADDVYSMQVLSKITVN